MHLRETSGFLKLENNTHIGYSVHWKLPNADGNDHESLFRCAVPVQSNAEPFDSWRIPLESR